MKKGNLLHLSLFALMMLALISCGQEKKTGEKAKQLHRMFSQTQKARERLWPFLKHGIALAEKSESAMVTESVQDM